LAFDEYKKQQLGKFIQNQKLFEEEEKMIDDQEKQNIERDGLRNILADSWILSQQNKLSDAGFFLYDNLKSRSLIDLSNAEKTSIQKEALKRVKYFAKVERYAALDKITYNRYNNFINSLSAEVEEVVIMSKKIALKTQIQKWIREGFDLNDIQSKIK
jgi:ATP-dependent RNA circularization protein (DNA/RNA ligase family)